MSIRTGKTKVEIWLPKALEGQQGLVDKEILYTLCHMIPKSSAKIRKLISDLSGVTLKPTDSAIEKLAALIPDPQFLLKWFNQEHRKFPCLRHLVSLYIEAHEDTLSYNELKKIHFLTRHKTIKELCVPNLDEIPQLITRIESAQIDDRFLSLFVWKLITETRLNGVKYPGERSILEFESKFSDALIQKKLEHLLLSAQSADWNIQVEKSECRECETEVLENTVKDAQAHQHRCEVSARLRIDLNQLERKIQRYNSNLPGLFAKAKSLVHDDDHTTSLRQLKEQASNLEETFLALEQEANSLFKEVSSSVESRLSELGLKVMDFEPPKFRITTPEHWFSQASERIERNESILSELDKFEDLIIKEIIRNDNFQSKQPCKYEEIDDALKASCAQYNRINTGISAERKFVTTITENLDDLDWNVFADPNLTEQTWIQLAEYYISKQELGPRLGIISQKVFDDIGDSLGCLLSEKVSKYNKFFVEPCIQTLSWLTLAQQEHLASAFPELKNVIAITQLEAYFRSIELKIDYYIYWSSSPLSEIYQNYSSSHVKNFFRAIYDILSAQPDSPLDLQTLIFCASSTQIGNSKSKSANESLGKFTNELREILAYKTKGGRTTYAHIWQAAYEAEIAPFLRTLNEFGMGAFVSEYESWQSSFNIDHHIDVWKSGIADHLKKNSEYDKFIRNQFSVKTTEISNWIKKYYSVKQKNRNISSDPFAKLKSAIAALFRATDHDSMTLLTWLELKSPEQSINTNNYICQTRDWRVGSDLVTPFNEIDARHPRAFSKSLSGSVSYEYIYADDLIYSFGFNSTAQLVEIYANNEIFEGYFLIANSSSEEISPVLDRKVERRTEEISLGLRQRISTITESLTLNTNVELDSILSAINGYLDNQQWRKAEKEIDSAELLVNEISSTAIALEERNNILEKLRRFGADISVNASNDELQRRLTDLLRLYKGRRSHIRVIEKLLELKSTGFEQQLHDCLSHLDTLEKFPEDSISEQVGYYLEQAIEPLHNELSRSETLLQTYVAQLKRLGKQLLLNIRWDENLFEEDSSLISILIDTAEQWQSLSSEGKSGVAKILAVFDERGYQAPALHLPIDHHLETGEQSSEPQFPDVKDSNAQLLDTLRQRASEASLSSIDDSDGIDLINTIKLKDWEKVSGISLSKLRTENFKSSENLANWFVSSTLSDFESASISDLSSTLKLINEKYPSSVIRYLHQDKSSKSLIADLVSLLIKRMAVELKLNGVNDGSTSIEYLQLLSKDITKTVIYQDSFRKCFEVDSLETIGVKSFWDKFAGDQKQAEARAQFMFIAWKMHASRTLAYCLTLPPVELDKRKAEALARVAEEALSSGNADLLQGFFDLKKSIQAKPFQIFTDLALSDALPQVEHPAKLTLLGGLERHEDGTVRSILRIEPRRVDSPDSITLKLPSNSPVRFSNGGSSEKFNGPFFTATSLPIIFQLLDDNAVSFNLEIDCISTSLTGIVSNFLQKIEFNILGETVFEPLSPDEIDDAFDNFPDAHMRGDDYVSRDADEQKIEKALFKSRTVRSVWISSPRRSGKTTMLYRILDGYSHKAGQDNLVVYLTLDEYFSDATAFNRWIWRRLNSLGSNKELRALYSDFQAIGKHLPYDSDTGTFLCQLSDKLLAGRNSGTRVIYLIDEIDRFASMYFEGGDKRRVAVDILWQIRHGITERRDIGMVFAGSSAARQVFIANAESPFYNSIDHLELTPFSCKTRAMEDASRKVVQPHRIRPKYELPKDSLEHLIWVCAGIPYYMKLVAGATYARAKQTHILKTDVNEGLRSLLARDTGISKLDDMGGDPGSDDLRTTISLEKNIEGILAKAVLYSIADLHSPISGHRTYRGKITSSESRLVAHYKISKESIERGLDICIGLGLVKVIETESVPEIDFAIPILGESIRKSSGRHWAHIDHELMKLAQNGA